MNTPFVHGNGCENRPDRLDWRQATRSSYWFTVKRQQSFSFCIKSLGFTWRNEWLCLVALHKVHSWQRLSVISSDRLNSIIPTPKYQPWESLKSNNRVSLRTIRKVAKNWQRILWWREVYCTSTRQDTRKSYHSVRLQVAMLSNTAFSWNTSPKLEHWSEPLTMIMSFTNHHGFAESDRTTKYARWK